jgi:hypothetical protein
MALPAASLGAALVLDALRPRGRAWAYATVGGLVGAVLRVPFLVV